MLLLSLTFLLHFNSPVLTQNPVQNFIEIENYCLAIHHCRHIWTEIWERMTTI